jgi:RNA 2',3'-cyclic 3'-phosphodiesterase
MLRTFVALELPDEVRAAISETIGRLRAELKERDGQVRWVDPGATHLTLKFLGPTAEEAVDGVGEAMRRALAEHANGPLRLTTSHVGFFPGPRVPRVVWLGLDGELERLGALRDALEESIAPLGWPTEARPFAPHLTLGRLRPQASPAERAGVGRVLGQVWAPEPLAFQVDQVSLMLSELGPAGARYTRLVGVPLG